MSESAIVIVGMVLVAAIIYAALSIMPGFVSNHAVLKKVKVEGTDCVYVSSSSSISISCDWGKE